MHSPMNVKFAKQMLENIHVHNVFPSADSTYIPYQWDMKFVDRSQPLQKALSLHFFIKTTEPTTLAFFMFISVTVQTR
jgi:hypothetical protein